MCDRKIEDLFDFVAELLGVSNALTYSLLCERLKILKRERSRVRDMELGKAVERGAVRLAAPATVLMESPGAPSFRVLCERMGTINLPKPVIPSAAKSFAKSE